MGVRYKPEDILWPLNERAVEAINTNFDLLFKDLRITDEKILPVTSGGTGLAAYTKGDLLVATRPTVLSPLHDVALGNVLLSGGVGEVPSYGKADLTLHVTGELPIANGGTGASTATAGFNNLAPSIAKGDLIVHDGASNDNLPVGTSGYVLFADDSAPMGVAWKRLPISSLANRFLRDAASTDLAGYKQLTVAHATGADVLLTYAGLASGDTLLEEWATEAGDPGVDFHPEGIWHLHIHARQSAGTKTSQIWCRIYRRTDPGGVETLVGTTEATTDLTGAETDYDLEIALSEFDVDPTDRLVFKVYATVAGSGTAPTVVLYIAGDTSARVEYPISGGSGGTALPLTTKGDLLTRDASTDVRLEVGADGEVLTADSTATEGLSWQPASGLADVLLLMGG